MAETSVPESSKEDLITRLSQQYNEDNREVIMRLLGEVNQGDYISIYLNNGLDITGRVLNLFYPQEDPFYQSSQIYDRRSGKPIEKSYSSFGIKINEAQAEEVAHYEDIKSYKRIH